MAVCITSVRPKVALGCESYWQRTEWVKALQRLITRVGLQTFKHANYRWLQNVKQSISAFLPATSSKCYCKCFASQSIRKGRLQGFILGEEDWNYITVKQSERSCHIVLTLPRLVLPLTGKAPPAI